MCRIVTTKHTSCHHTYESLFRCAYRDRLSCDDHRIPIWTFSEYTHCPECWDATKKDFKEMMEALHESEEWRQMHRGVALRKLNGEEVGMKTVGRKEKRMMKRWSKGASKGKGGREGRVKKQRKKNGCGETMKKIWAKTCYGEVREVE